MVLKKKERKTLMDKQYTIKKGQEQFKVWSRGNDSLFELMTSHRPYKNVGQKLKKAITVRIIVTE